MALFAAVLAALVLAACGDDDDDGDGSAGEGGTIALLLPETKTTRYEEQDHPNFERRVGEICPDCEVIYSLGPRFGSRPRLEDAAEIARAGADLIAVDATQRPRPGGETATEFLRAIGGLGIPVLADVDSLAPGIAAREAGADAVATTLSGYTSREPPPPEPDLGLVAELAGALDCPVFAEDRYATPAAIAAAFDRGAFAVVVGAAITDPTALTERLVAATPSDGTPR